MPNASDLFVQTLVAEGVEYIFGVPGEENLTFLESVRQSPLKFIATRHEQAAGFMAATVGRLTGNPGVALSTLGPGATNLVTAVAYAQLGGMPALFLTGQKPIKHSKQGHFQIIDVLGMMKPLTKLSRQIVSPQLVAPTLEHALKLAREERPGSVHLELPEDIALESLDQPITTHNLAAPRRPIAEDKAIITAVSMLASAKHPLIIVGSGANRKRVSKMLTYLVDKTGLPVVATQMGKGVLDERRSEYLGTTALTSNDYIHEEIARADLILHIGHDTIEKPPFLTGASKSPKIIHLNFSPSTPDLVYSPDHEVVGDIANALWRVAEALTPQKSWDLSVFHGVTDRVATGLSLLPSSPLAIIRDLRQALADDDIVTLDNGMYKLYFARHYETRAPNTLLLDNALATMGAGLPSAIAAKLLYPERRVVAVCGDGGFMMSASELETAKRLGIDLVVIVLSDNSFGMIDWKQRGMQLPSFGLSFGNPNFVQYATSFGITGHRVDEDHLLSSLLKTALDQGGIHLIEAKIDYEGNKYLGVKP